MDKMLRDLFDYQKFAGNSNLEKLIKETESRYENKMLSDEDLDSINAAGSVNRPIDMNDSGRI